MWKTSKRTFWLCTALVMLCAVAWIGGRCYQAFHTFRVEGQIHSIFFPVAKALYGYEQDHHSPAMNLSQLIPDYLTAIPSSPYAESVEYSVINDGKVWQLDIHSHALAGARLYCCRSTQKFTPDEERRVLRKYHACWTVLRERLNQ